MRQAILETVNENASLSDYDRIAVAIRYIGERRLDQPDLAEVAAVTGLSPHHFQRLFTRWVGVSPKRFLSYLTQRHARALLAQDADVLSASLEVGLSGPGRLHDLCVTLEAATPGEIKSGGEGMDIRVGMHDTPFGQMALQVTDRGISGLTFAHGEMLDDRLERAKKSWPNARFIDDTPGTRELADAIFAKPEVRKTPFNVLVSGTNFQVQVWQALVRLPEGKLTTYGRIAEAIGRPTAQRAVGNAVGRNAVAFLIPCHRVVRENSLIGSYHWGTERKAAMIGWEAARCETRKAAPGE